MKILIVVDCQPGFGITDDMDLVKNTVKKIQEFKERNDPVIVLEFRGHKRTVNSILELIEDYPDGVILEKSYNDGSDEIKDHLYHHTHIPDIDEAQFCGVNLDCCVLDTAIGLGKKYPRMDMTILHECCGATGNRLNWATETVLRVQKQHDNVCLVGRFGEPVQY